ncbi:MAG TPA: glycosyltransferase [Candidatus Sulfotelmatobacter sp.]|jgi:cellulose synthase/poly-beta-1,6-N-acetylglucosamine synthase-like glycosyltransferase/spore germination protein YaaH/peptidoglycan/xylan/chitin deacetylase (PgdA/CDA1 family)|nr:glycosyltransferase [Candidatus Sulfotelmatobacter sp.]
MKERKPIFYDSEKVRWRRTRRILEVSGGLLTLLLIYFFLTIAGSVELPAALLPDTRPIYHAVKKKLLKPVVQREGRHKRVANIGQVPAKYDPLRAAFFVSWDPNSLASLKKHYKDIDLLMPEQLHAVTADGAITVVDYERNQTVKASPGEALSRLQQDKLHQWMRAMNPPLELPMMGLLNNYDGVVWRVKEMAELLANPGARGRLISDATQYAVAAKQAGIVVDFEEVPDESQENFQKFIGQFAPALHAVGLKLMIALPARDDSYNYEFFGKETDAIILMNYDQHWLTSPPGPIAAQDWFVENLRQVLEVVPAQKIVVGIANYSYDWTETSKKEKPHAEEFSIQEALLHAYESESEVEFDAASLNPHYSYSDEKNHTHQVWMLDAVTAYNELRASERLGVQGTALWRLGSSDSSLWPVWDATHADDAARAKLADLPPGPDLILEGDGDIWHIADVPKQGHRTITYDPATALITGEKYEAYPLSYDIDQIGAAKNKIVLSFDDGPDRRWTPEILDILKEKKAPGIFFVIGDQANRAPDLLKREYNEGHEIGNHTFTHPQFDEISRTQLKWELNLTQRLIESTLGVKSLFFRPPYGIDHQPEYAEEVAQLPYPQELGYIIVGQRIDPDDWRMTEDKRQRPAQEIADDVVRQAKNGNIVLLHDGGGEREQTVTALPLIIDELRARGYQFVSVADLLGKTRADLMLPLTFRERMAAQADGFIFGIFQWSRFAIATVFILGIVLVSGRALIIGILAIIEKLRPDNAKLAEPPPGVTVLIPAYNEESVIVQTVQSVLLSDLDDIRVIVVDDGSSDRTLELLESNFDKNNNVQIIHQVNRGKAAALNNALSHAKTEFVVTIDADTEIEPDAIRKLLRHFSDPKVGAVAGNVKVGNRSRWLTRWQALEYITSQNMEKRAFDLLNCITVVPGALGAWRREAIEAVGGITADTVAEDADLTIAIRRLGWRVTYDEEAIAWTEAPETPGQLIRQRFRWTFGTLQSFWKHSDTLFRPKYGTLGWVALPNIFVFQILLPLFSPVLDLLFLGSLVLWGLAGLHITQIPQLWTAADVQHSVVFFLGFLLIDVLTCVIAFALERHEDWTLLIPVLLQRFYYRQLMYIVLFRSVKEAVSGRPVGWKGVEKEPPAMEPATL